MPTPPSSFDHPPTNPHPLTVGDTHPHIRRHLNPTTPRTVNPTPLRTSNRPRSTAPQHRRAEPANGSKTGCRLTLLHCPSLTPLTPPLCGEELGLNATSWAQRSLGAWRSVIASKLHNGRNDLGVPPGGRTLPQEERSACSTMGRAAFGKETRLGGRDREGGSRMSSNRTRSRLSARRADRSARSVTSWGSTTRRCGDWVCQDKINRESGKGSAPMSGNGSGN